MNPILEAAIRYTEAGLSVIPCRKDKRPCISWQACQRAVATRSQVEEWFTTAEAIAIVGGAVSGGIVCIDFDLKYDLSKTLMKDWNEIVESMYGGLSKRLLWQRTPSGGYHAVMRYKYSGSGNRKLAQRPTTEEEKASNESDRSRVLIETREEGGYFLAAPSPGYTLCNGSDFAAIPEVDVYQFEILMDACKHFNQLPDQTVENGPRESSYKGVTPYDDYNRRTTVQNTEALLNLHGWITVRAAGERITLRRPGKVDGISATLNYIPGALYVFSSSSGFEMNRPYSHAAVYAMLEHGGDHSAAAKSLYAQGYGDRLNTPAVVTIGGGPVQKPVSTSSEDAQQKCKVVAVGDFSDRIKNLYYIDESDKGILTQWDNLKDIYRVVKGQMTVVTGIPSHGKSEWVDALFMGLVKSHGWKILYFSPENYPFELHFKKLCEKYIGKPMHGTGRMSLDEVAQAAEFLNEHFFFLDPAEDGINLDTLLNTVKDFNDQKTQIDGFCIDPWNELEHTRPREFTESEYIGWCLSKIRRFARKNKMGAWIVAHPTKLQKDKVSGVYPVPTLYDINGSANWYNKADNGIVVYRDFEKKITKVLVQKVKFRYHGMPGEAMFKYDLQSGNYQEIDGIDEFELNTVERSLPWK